MKALITLVIFKKTQKKVKNWTGKNTGFHWYYVTLGVHLFHSAVDGRFYDLQAGIVQFFYQAEHSWEDVCILKEDGNGTHPQHEASSQKQQTHTLLEQDIPHGTFFT